MQELLIITVLTLHLICVNVAAAGPLVCIWLDWRGGRGDLLAARVGRFLCWKSLWLLLVGGALGLLLGILHWDDTYRDVLRQFPSKIYFGIWELIFSLVLISITAVWWQFAPHAKIARFGRAVLLVLTGTNLLYHFPFLFTIIARVHAGETNPDGIVDAAAFRGLMMEDSVLPQALHFGLASFAMVGMTLIGDALWCDRRQVTHHAAALPAGESSRETDEPTTENAGASDGAVSEHASDLQPESQRIAIWGGRLALIATLCQVPVGIWLVVALAPGVQARVLGEDLIASGSLGVSIFLSLGLLHHLASIAFGQPRRRGLVISMAIMAALITLMTSVLQRI